MSEAAGGMWAIFSNDKPVKLYMGSKEGARWFARGLLGEHANISIHELVTVTERERARNEAIEEAAKVCREKAVAEAPPADDVEKGWEAGCLSCEVAIKALTTKPTNGNAFTQPEADEFPSSGGRRSAPSEGSNERS